MHLFQSQVRVWYDENGGNPQYDKDMEWELLEPKLIEKHVGEGFLGHPITKDDVHLQLLGTLTVDEAPWHPNIVWVHDANTQPLCEEN